MSVFSFGCEIVLVFPMGTDIIFECFLQCMKSRRFARGTGKRCFASGAIVGYSIETLRK